MPKREDTEFAEARRRAFLRRHFSVEVNSYLDDLEDARECAERKTGEILESTLAAATAGRYSNR
ncbi:uncharacterized protein RMCB_3480 [Mycolicibacterium brisbanense]|uniref:Uncharacterized protein n=1 Tax=Mycolicibacterium brisbanense TaxID=146020 RepID=A0A100W0H5_9MYCO|nr:uncharacterized protein RMCB_3480 [Mycolicibacterium brisbanense]